MEAAISINLSQKIRSTGEATIRVNPMSGQKKRSTGEATISVNPNKQQKESVPTISDTPSNTSRANAIYEYESTSAGMDNGRANAIIAS